MEARKEIIQSYISAYNAFDVAGMLAHLADDVVFENVSGGEVNLRTDGKDAFKAQAEQALAYFSKRKQTPTSWTEDEDTVTVEIDYSAILGMDFPNGMKKGDPLTMKGRSEFGFSGNEIVSIRDFS